MMFPMVQNAMFLQTDGSQVCCGAGMETDLKSVNMILFTAEFYASLSHAWQLREGCEDYWSMTLHHKAMLPSSGRQWKQHIGIFLGQFQDTDEDLLRPIFVFIVFKTLHINNNFIMN